MKKYIIFITALSIVAFSGCKKDTEASEPETEITEEKEIAATDNQSKPGIMLTDDMDSFVAQEEPTPEPTPEPELNIVTDATEQGDPIDEIEVKYEKPKDPVGTITKEGDKIKLITDTGYRIYLLETIKNEKNITAYKFLWEDWHEDGMAYGAEFLAGIDDKDRMLLYAQDENKENEFMRIMEDLKPGYTAKMRQQAKALGNDNIIALADTTVDICIESTKFERFGGENNPTYDFRKEFDDFINGTTTYEAIKKNKGGATAEKVDPTEEKEEERREITIGTQKYSFVMDDTKHSIDLKINGKQYNRTLDEKTYTRLSAAISVFSQKNPKDPSIAYLVEYFARGNEVAKTITDPDYGYYIGWDVNLDGKVTCEELGLTVLKNMGIPEIGIKPLTTISLPTVPMPQL